LYAALVEMWWQAGKRRQSADRGTRLLRTGLFSDPEHLPFGAKPWSISAGFEIGLESIEFGLP
jgi:hypothetical protein